MKVVALSGRRIDAENGPVARFPLDRVPAVRNAIRGVFQSIKAEGLVCSAACGADLLALDVADELGLNAEVVLPFAAERFRSTSVTDRPGDWGPLFDRLVVAAQQRDMLTVVEHEVTEHEAYLRVNEMLLLKALELAKHSRRREIAREPGSVTAVIVWEGDSRGADDLTGHFAASAQTLNIPVCGILI